jgi:NAD(P)-dependent dehydrogenase (short-subunit alcohol dehydrogenase family)
MKTILITGGNSNTGIAVAQVLAEHPCRLALHYYSNQSKAEQIQAYLDSRQLPNGLFRYDLTRPRQAEELIAQTLEQFGSIDVLINVVGPFVYKSILEVTPLEWQNDINLNLHSCFYTTHYALDALRRSRGHIINFAFAGVENNKARPMSVGYCAAKSGVVALTKSLAVALAPDGVRANAVCPGLVEDEDIGEEERQQMASQIPYGRPVYAEEIAKTVEWLVWNSPETMTGALLSVAGGWEY